jgi:hypothetical protein
MKQNISAVVRKYVEVYQRYIETPNTVEAERKISNHRCSQMLFLNKHVLVVFYGQCGIMVQCGNILLLSKVTDFKIRKLKDFKDFRKHLIVLAMALDNAQFEET